MRLDAQRERLLERRKGLALRTILSVTWLLLCFAGAYVLVTYLFDSEVITKHFIRVQLRIPYDVPDNVIVIALMIVMVVAINFVVLVVYSFFSAAGRRRPGTPSMYSAEPDPDDRKYDYR